MKLRVTTSSGVNNASLGEKGAVRAILGGEQGSLLLEYNEGLLVGRARWSEFAGRKPFEAAAAAAGVRV